VGEQNTGAEGRKTTFKKAEQGGLAVLGNRLNPPTIRSHWDRRNDPAVNRRVV